MEDNIHDGYLIPKGALVIANIWCDSIYSRSHVDLMFLISRQMLHDPEVYSDPTTFRPERFLGPKPEPDPRQICFGFGRRYGASSHLFKVRRAQEFFRICPGKVLADASVFISCAMVLSVFNVTKYSENGRIIEPVVDQTTGTIR